MAQWQRNLDMRDVWDSDDVPLVARTAAQRLKELQPFTDFPYIEDKKEELVDELESLSTDDSITYDDFNWVWNEVYDWADTALDNHWNGKKVCWIQTF